MNNHSRTYNQVETSRTSSPQTVLHHAGLRKFCAPCLRIIERMVGERAKIIWEFRLIAPLAKPIAD